MKKVVKYAFPVVVAALVVAVSGCAGMGKGAAEKDKIAKTLADWKTAVEASNMDAMLVQYSDDFKGENGGKAELKVFLKRVIDAGYLKGSKVDLTKANTDIKGGEATVSPIFLSGGQGGITITLGLKKDKDTVWRIVSSENG